MPQDPSDKETARLEESNMCAMNKVDAMINILERVGLLTRNEVMKEIEILQGQNCIERPPAQIGRR